MNGQIRRCLCGRLYETYSMYCGDQSVCGECREKMRGELEKQKSQTQNLLKKREIEAEIETVTILRAQFGYLKSKIADLEKENEKLTKNLEQTNKNYHSLLKRLYAIDEICKFIV